MVSPVIVARVAFALLGLSTFITVVYTCATDGSPFRWEILTPWMAATLIDFYVNVAVIASWVWYKEETWLGRIVWTVLLICTGSMATGLYVVIQLFKIAPTDPLYYALLRPVHVKYATIPPSRTSHLPAESSSFSQWLP